MYDVPNDLSEYISFITNCPDLSGNFAVPSDSAVYAAILGLYKAGVRRRKNIKAVFTALSRSGYVNACKLKFAPYVKEKAYMSDAGSVCFSLAHIYRTHGATMIKLVLHEAAHLWLSQQPSYARLKSLNKSFRAAYPNADCAALSPIEYYAIALSTVMLERLLSAADDSIKPEIHSQIEREKTKLTNFRVLSD